MYIFEVGRKARLVQQRGGGAGISSITAKRFWHRIIVYFSISKDSQEEDFGDTLLYILYMGGRGLAGQSRGHTKHFSSQLFIANNR